jgi:sulfatase modifying factor 1
MKFVHVPGGIFVYGPEECYERLEQSPPLRPRQDIYLDAFNIGVYPVTYAEWKTFLDDAKWKWEGRWWTILPGLSGFFRRYAPVERYPAKMADHPIVDVTRRDACAFCGWLSKKINRPCTLPSEEQWEKAARGTDGRTYPWGEQHPRPDVRWQSRSKVGFETWLYNLVVKPWREWARSGWYWRNGSPVQVGAIPQNVSPYGCCDMAGNVWEWTSSLYNPEVPGFYAVKGGSWDYSVHHTKLYVRSTCSVTIPSDQYHAPGTGFRVAYADETSASPS